MKKSFKDKVACNRKYQVNHKVFNNINTEEKAYWLGFLYADGYVNLERGEVKIVLQDSDYDHLVKFNNFLKSNYPIKYDRKYPKIVICSHEITNDLIKFGCMQAKTHKLQYPKFLKSSLQRHFIRGYFDGDGCITHIKNVKYGYLQPYFNIVGRKRFILNIQRILMSKCVLNKTKLAKRHKDRINDIFTLNYGGTNNVKKIYNFLYKNNKIKLDRKDVEFKKLLKYE